MLCSVTLIILFVSPAAEFRLPHRKAAVFMPVFLEFIPLSVSHFTINHIANITFPI
jgi:hypothetical protein